MKKAVFSFLAVLAVIFCIPAAAYAIFDKTADDAVAWVMGHEEGVGYEYDGAVDTYIDGKLWIMTNQCVDLIRGYMDYISGTHTRGNAGTYTYNDLPEGYDRIQKYDGFVPAKGDILIWSGEPGHVAICTAVNSQWEIVYSDQNGDGSYKKVKHGRTMNPQENDYWGVIRPEFKPSDTVAPVVNVARIQNKTSEGFDVVVEAVDNCGVSAIKIGTWHSRMSIDNAVWSPEVSPNQNGRVILHVSYSDFSNTSGAVFYTNAYAIDAAGNWSEAVLCYSFEDLGDDFYATIIQDSSGGFWENNSNQIIISEDTGYAFYTDPIHIWHFIKQKTGDYAGSYEIISEYNDRCVDINSFGFEEGTSVGLLERAHNAAQRFYICLDTRSGYPRYYFRASYCNKVLDVHGSVTELGGIIWLWTPNYSDAQLFQINDLADGGLNYPGSVPPPTPTIQKSISGQNATLSWNSPVVNQFDSRAYNVSLYTGSTSSGTALYDNANTTDTSHIFSLDPGIYTLKVTAINTKYKNLVTEASYTFSMTGSYTVTYDANGGTDAPLSQNKIHDTPLTLSSDEPKREASTGRYTVRFKTIEEDGTTIFYNPVSVPWTTSYTFKNWNTDKYGTGTSYAPGATYTANASATLYAQWNSTKTTGSVPFPDSPTRPGYVFMGWATRYGASRGNFGSYTPTRDGDVTLYATWKKMDIVLPEALNEIESEAFDGCAFSSVMLSEKTETISGRAFVDCPNLKYIYIPAATTAIAADAFAGVDGLTILGASGSYAEAYAKAHGYTFVAIS